MPATRIAEIPIDGGELRNQAISFKFTFLTRVGIKSRTRWVGSGSTGRRRGIGWSCQSSTFNTPLTQYHVNLER